MKKLKKILLINWLYFSKQLIDIDDVNFLTGKNGAGKSTVIDALQIVLLGELNARNFNKAASETSQRTLDGYLRADTEDGGKHSRRGKAFASYIACEYLDDVQDSRFVTGVVFDCRSDGSRRETFFIYDGVIPEDCFLRDKQAMDGAALRAMLRADPDARAHFYDSGRSYRTDLTAKWNVPGEQVFRMLKKAVSFKPIVDIQQFITENICDVPDRPDVAAMQQNIRDYRHHEQLASQQVDKLAVLDTIADRHRLTREAADRLTMAHFLTDWAEKEDVASRIDRLAVEEKEASDALAQVRAEHDALDAKWEALTARREQLIADRAGSDVYQEVNRLNDRKKQLLQEQKRLRDQLDKSAAEVRREAKALTDLCTRMADLPEDAAGSGLKEHAAKLTEACGPLVDCTAEVFSGDGSVFAMVQEATGAFASGLRDASWQMENRLAARKAEQDRSEGVMASLRRNVKDYPRGLLTLRQRLMDGLKQRTGQDVTIEILADALEIAEGQEQWRGAVEGYLNTQKFNLLVEPAWYDDALAVYDEAKRELGRATFGLVDVGRLRESEHPAPEGNSLAAVVETESELCRSYVDYLLGKVVCCERTDQLRQYRTAITAEGMLYQSYVARPLPRERMEDAFIGRKAVALRLGRIERELSAIREDVAAWTPLVKELNRQKDRESMFTQRYIQGEAAQRRTECLRVREIDQDAAEVDEQLSRLDLFVLSELDRKIEETKGAMKALSTSREDCMTRQARLTARLEEAGRILPGLRRDLADRQAVLRQQYPAPYPTKTGVPRYQQELARLHQAGAVAKHFRESIPQSAARVQKAQAALMEVRADYARRFPPCNFPMDAEDNAAYDEERRLLSESELPSYREKINRARESAMEQFRSDFLARIKASIDQVQDQVRSLNRALKRAQFGTDRYQFRVDRNPDYAAYYDMMMDPDLMAGDGGLLAIPFRQKYGALIEEMFSRITAADDDQLNARSQTELQQNIDRYTDFRTYLKFDLETTDQDGVTQLLSRTLNTKSGGETQTPFYIAVLASFAQLYQVNSLSPETANTARLVIFDEAFNKMDSERIIQSVRLLRKMHLQAIICTPPDKLPDIMPQADRTLLVTKEAHRMSVLTYTKRVKADWAEEAEN